VELHTAVVAVAVLVEQMVLHLVLDIMEQMVEIMVAEALGGLMYLQLPDMVV
jgi:hypothetical protein